MHISENQYVSLTTFTKDGRPKTCPVWVVNIRHRDVGFTTESTSWKARRISHTPQVELQPCNSRGVLAEGSAPISGLARLTFDDEFQNIQNAVKAKYGLQYSVAVFVGKVRNFFSRSDSSSCGVIITIEP